MVEVVTSLASGGEPDVDYMVRSRYKADHTGYEEYCTLEAVFWFSDCEGSHAKESNADQQKNYCCTYGFPVLPDFGMVPAVHRLCGLHIFVDQ